MVQSINSFKRQFKQLSNRFTSEMNQGFNSLSSLFHHMVIRLQPVTSTTDKSKRIVRPLK